MRRKTMVGVIGLWLLSSTPGCAALGQALITAMQVSQGIDTALGLAETGARAYYARHPRQDDEAKVDAALRAARAALVAYDAALRAKDGEAEARAAALASYDALVTLLRSLGVLDARPPEGGVETGAPLPRPFALPSARELDVTR